MNFLHVALSRYDKKCRRYTSEASSCYLTFMDIQKQPFYLMMIKRDLSERQRSNSQYSLRAYARDIGIHASTLSQILNGNRPLPFKDSATVVRNLKLDQRERTLFMESLMRKKTSLDAIKIDDLDRRFMLDESYYKIIAEWEHFAVLDLFELDNFTPTVESIALKLDLTLTRTQVVLSNLFLAELLKEENGELIKVHDDIRTTEDIFNAALRDSHIEAMQMGVEKIKEIEVELRDFSSTTVGVDLDKLPEAKTIIREFRQKMTALLRDGRKTDVYQLAIQFYPLTKPEFKKMNH